jgi:hypothetical protein
MGDHHRGWLGFEEVALALRVVHAPCLTMVCYGGSGIPRFFFQEGCQCNHPVRGWLRWLSDSVRE